MGVGFNPKEMMEYQIVAILGVTGKNIEVACLIRAESFKGLFREKSGDGSEVRFVIPKDESYRFSHEIPSHRFDEKCSIGFLRGKYVLDPFLVPKKDGECFSFSDPFLLERSQVHPGWRTIKYIVDKEKNGLSLDSKENVFQHSENNSMDIIEQQEDEDLYEGSSNPDEFSPPEVQEGNHMELQAVDDGNIHRIPCIKYYDFDDRRSETSFEMDQLWAVHDWSDGLPHSYVRINKSLDSEGKVEVVPLEPHPLVDEEMRWAEENLPIACGTFKATKSTCIIKMTDFSHKVVYDKENPSRLFYRVFPRKGEVWATYLHWSLGWTSSNMKNNVEYKLVEVVSDFTEEAGVIVAALVREEGQENIFRRQLHEGFWLFMAYKRKELLRFSHCIPSVRIMRNRDGSASEELIKIKFSHTGL